MLTLNSGLVPLGGNGTLNATVNATAGSAGQSSPVVAGKINLTVSVPPSLLISATQNGIPTGWVIKSNTGSVINICNGSTTIPVNTAVEILIDLQGISITSGAPTMTGQLSFKTNCTGPGSLAGDNPSDNSGQAGFSVSNTTPVTLTGFNAALINCQPVLNWTTEYEMNSDRFEIERTKSGAANWISAGIVNALGNTTIKSHYSFSDNSIIGSSEKILYRLKMIDRDGHYKYSPVLPVLINCKTVQVSAYPNPVENNNLLVSITGINGSATATLLSLSGQVMLRSNLSNGTTALDVSKLASGVYILNISDEKLISKKVKVIIMH
jgi:hypothetical protein